MVYPGAGGGGAGGGVGTWIPSCFPWLCGWVRLLPSDLQHLQRQHRSKQIHWGWCSPRPGKGKRFPLPILHRCSPKSCAGYSAGWIILPVPAQVRIVLWILFQKGQILWMTANEAEYGQRKLHHYGIMPCHIWDYKALFFKKIKVFFSLLNFFY